MTQWFRCTLIALCTLVLPGAGVAQTCDWSIPTPAVCGEVLGDALDERDLFHRDIFLSWVLEEWRVGNIRVLEGVFGPLGQAPELDLPPLNTRFTWFGDKSDHPAQTVLWCSLDSVAEAPVTLDTFVVEGMLLADPTADLAQVQFWLGYDLLTQGHRTVIQALDSDVTQTGRLEVLPETRDLLAAQGAQSQCVSKPWMEVALSRAVARGLPEAAQMQDAADAALHLDAALVAELAALPAPQVPKEAKPDDLRRAVNRQLVAEVSAGGQIETRILSQAKQLAGAFRALDSSINGHAQHIDRLNADILAVDRNLRTYTEVFDDHSRDAFQQRFETARTDLESVLAQRDLLEPSIEPMWLVDDRGTADPQDDIWLLNPENKTVDACQNDPDCDYCQFSEPLNGENLEAHLVCFQAVGVAQAEQAREFAVNPRYVSQSANPQPATWEACIQAIDPESPPAHQDLAARNCFLEWMWDVDPIATARLEAAFASD